MPDPCAYNDRSSFVSDCVSERQRENPSESASQSVAACSGMWDDRQCGAASQRSFTQPVYKAAKLLDISSDEAVFLASSEKVDRMGDIVRQNWDLTGFNQNPVLAYGHATDASAFPIGKVARFWTDLGDSFARTLRLPAGMDETADKVWLMIKEEFLNAVSVGFLPLERPKELVGKRGEFLGYEFPRNELLELSVVMVPAHRDALAVQREFKLSNHQMNQIFQCPKGVSTGDTRTVRAARRRAEIARLRASNL